jgi:hypothetical protein
MFIVHRFSGQSQERSVESSPHELEAMPGKRGITRFLPGRSRLAEEVQPGLEVVLAAFVPLMLYLQTLARTVYTFDSGEITVAAYTLGLVHAPGYPLYLLLAKGFTFIPIGTIAYRVNLMSAVFASLAVAEIYWLIVRLTWRKWAALAAAWLLAASPVFWSQAVVASTYPLHIFFVMSMLLVISYWLTKRNTRWLFALALLYGLSLANHTSTVLLLPGILTLLCLRWRHSSITAKSFCTMVILLGLGCMTYLYLPVRYLANTANYVSEYFGISLASWQGMWWIVTGKMFRPEMFGYPIWAVPEELFKYTTQLWINTSGVGSIVGLAGFWRFFRKGGQDSLLALLTALWLCANIVFYVNYRVINKQTMFVFSYAIWAIPTGMGFAQVERLVIEFIQARARGLTSALTQFAGTALLVPALMAMVANLPARDLSHRSDVANYAQAVFQCARPNALILAGWLSAGPLQYYQVVEGQRRDVTILNTSFYALGVRDQAYRVGQGQDFAIIVRDRLRTMLDVALQSRPVYVLEPGEYDFQNMSVIDESPCYRIVRRS